MAKSNRAGERPICGQVEGRDHLLGREDFLVAVAPAEPHQVVAHRRRQVAHGAIGIDAERAVTLRELGAVRPVDQRDVRHHRHGPAERLIDLGLPRGVVEVVVAADDVGHAHVVVVDHDGQHVGRIAVGAQQHEIVEVLVLPGDAALDLVLDHGLAGQRRLQPDRGLDAGRRVAGIAVAPAAVVEPRLALGAGLLAHRGELFRRGVAAIGMARRRASARPPRDGVRRARIDRRCRRPNRGRARSGRRGLRRSPARSSARGRCPRSAAASCRRDGARRAS